MSRIRGVGLVVGSAVGAAGVVTQVRKARAEADRLLLLNALANALVVITGLALAVRTLRKDKHS